MGDFLERKPGEAYTSRYIQFILPPKEGMDPSEGRASKPDTPDSLIQYNSAGGSINEFETTSELGKYTKVRVLGCTHAGHVLLFDETPDNERFYLIHPNGSYEDIVPDGRKVKTEGDEWNWVSKTCYVEIKEDKITFIHKNEERYIDLSQTEEIGTSRDVTIGTSDTESVGTSRTTTIGTEWSVTSGTHQVHVAPRIDFNP